MSDNVCLLREVYALGGLTGSEQEAFEVHLHKCLECQSELRRLETVTEALLFDFESVSPPAGMRDRVLKNVLGTSQVSPEEVERSSYGPEGDTGGTAHGFVVGGTRKKRTSRVWWSLSAAAAALVILASGVTYSIASRNVSSPFGDVTQSVSLNSKIPGATATMWVTHKQSTAQMLIHFKHLKPVTGTQVYQVWLIKNSTSAPYSAGVFTPDSQGNAAFAALVPSGTYPVIAVTLEPKAIDATPLGPIVMQAKI